MSGNKPSPSEVPFWRRKTLAEMTPQEWESLCDRCGRCCLILLQDPGQDVMAVTDLGCELLDPATGSCSDYPNRLKRVPDCLVVTLPVLEKSRSEPLSSCAYQRLHSGQDLEWWHPLVSGTFDTVRQAGISAAGRFVPRQLQSQPEFHTVDWPAHAASSAPRDNWLKAMFGGVNLPQFFNANAVSLRITLRTQIKLFHELL
jgi:uncharacterized cysteine cluster protein YcgN (CxxCxxCC family)